MILLKLKSVFCTDLSGEDGWR